MIKKKLKSKSAKKPDRVFPKFKQNTRWTMILEYRQGVTNRQYQKLGFKTESGGMQTANKEALRIAKTMSRGISVSLKEMEEEILCRVIALYQEDAFKSWTEEVGEDVTKTHLKEALKLVTSSKDSPKPKKIRTR